MKVSDAQKAAEKRYRQTEKGRKQRREAQRRYRARLQTRKAREHDYREEEIDKL